MIRVLTYLILSTLVGVTTVVNAASTDFQKAMKAFEKRHYDSAGKLLSSNINDVPTTEKTLANLSLGLIFLNNANLYNEFSKTALVSQLDYLQRLFALNGKAKSQYLGFYLAESYVEAGEFAKAIPLLEAFGKQSGQDAELQAIAQIKLGSCFYKTGKRAQAEALWKKYKSGNVMSDLEMLAVKEQLGIASATDRSTLNKAVSAVIKEPSRYSARALSNSIEILTITGDFTTALNLVFMAELDTSSFDEKFDANKVIRFYDISLLTNVADLYYNAAVYYLNLIKNDEKYGDTASFYLFDTALKSKNRGDTSALLARLKTAEKLPATLKALKPLYVATADFLNKNSKNATPDWEASSATPAADKLVLRETLIICISLNVVCNKTLSAALELSKRLNGKPAVPLNEAIGRYVLFAKSSNDYLNFLENARDKSNKNKIESNDPVLLVNLAEAYRRDKNYSESLEIYFELSKQFPIVRQIQESLQGIYSMDHKSAGDVSIF